MSVLPPLPDFLGAIPSILASFRIRNSLYSLSPRLTDGFGAGIVESSDLARGFLSVPTSWVPPIRDLPFPLRLAKSCFLRPCRDFSTRFSLRIFLRCVLCACLLVPARVRVSSETSLWMRRGRSHCFSAKGVRVHTATAPKRG